MGLSFVLAKLDCMDVSWKDAVLQELSRNKRDSELGEQPAEKLMNYIFKVHMALDKDFRNANVSGDVPTTCFDNAMKLIQSTLSAQEQNLKGAARPSATAMNHLLQNPIAMRCLGLLFYLKKQLSDSEIFMKNKLTEDINGNIGGVGTFITIQKQLLTPYSVCLLLC